MSASVHVDVHGDLSMSLKANLHGYTSDEEDGSFEVTCSPLHDTPNTSNRTLHYYIDILDYGMAIKSPVLPIL